MYLRTFDNLNKNKVSMSELIIKIIEEIINFFKICTNILGYHISESKKQ